MKIIQLKSENVKRLHGSLLDADSLAIVADMAKKADGQIWMERVSSGQEVSVVIEDGSVVAP
jgi:hypothetical protein